MFKETTATKKIKALSKKVRAVQGGTSASKTISILLYLIAMAQTDTTKTLTSIISESTPHLKRGSLRDFKNIMQAHGYWKQHHWNATDSIYTFETGSQIEFFSADQSDKLRGARRDRCFINECNNVTLDAFDQLEVRTKEFIFLDWNPTNEFWFYTDVQPERDDVEHIVLTYKDNEALDDQIVASIESRKERESWWKVYGLGLLGEVEGIIYKGWRIRDEVPHEARFEDFGLDFGWNPDAASLVAIYYYNGGYIIDEINTQLEWSNRDIATTIKNQEQEGVTIADSAEPKSIAEIRAYGVNIQGAVKGADSLRHGIKTMQDQKISVTKRSVNVIKGFRNWMWSTDKDGKIVAGVPEHEPDSLAAARYAINSLIPVHRRNEAIKQRGNPLRVKKNIAV